MHDTKSLGTETKAYAPDAYRLPDGVTSFFEEPIALLAVNLVDHARRMSPRPLVFIAASERRADRLRRIVRGFAPDLDLILIPAWDCLPYDRVSPSRAIMGERLTAMDWLSQQATEPRLVIATPDALIQRIPPHDAIRGAKLCLRRGEALDLDQLAARLGSIGYIIDERVDEPGEAALRGKVVDAFPAAASRPVRIEHEEGRIAALRVYDPVTQLTSAELEQVTLGPASECMLQAEDERFGGMEHWLPEFYPHLQTWFDLLPGASIVMDANAGKRCQAFLGQVTEAYQSFERFAAHRQGNRPPLPPERLYLKAVEWDALVAPSIVATVKAGEDGASRPTIPKFSSQASPYRSFTAFVRGEQSAGHRVIVTAATDRDLHALTRRLERNLRQPVREASDWGTAMVGPTDGISALKIDLESGFHDPSRKVTLIAAADVLGSRADTSEANEGPHQPLPLTELEFRIGDAVVHLDQGMGVLRGVEVVDTGSAGTDLIQVEYADGAHLMVPAEQLDRVWRYGSEAEVVTLDRLDSEAWEKRRATVEAQIEQTARRLVELTRTRQETSAAKLEPPRAAYEQFVARFPFAETPDQNRAIEDTLSDLASGHPMDRLVCGDVGFGKTEVALRAAAAAALSGKQVAIVAPTTVLARQHLQTFQRRFAGLGIEIGHLSRLVGPTRARAVKAGLADGSVHVVVGTHALAGKGVRFKDLGLVVIDEEQRFGTAQKRSLRRLAAGVHVLTLTATPIPRTLQAAMVGLQDISVVATPPARRQPARTFLTPFDELTIREALLRESRRGGQSFLVCPRVEDIQPLSDLLTRLVPELDVLIAHGRLPAEQIDEAMVRFADGQGDVLLATNIIESGLDVPKANTMLIWRADRFGLAQLHQLRGRVGRGRTRAFVYLLTDPNATVSGATRKRLETLQSLDRLGAGFAISARDLDLRGAGDLFGEDQAGHVKLIGIGLYQHLLRRALSVARGEPASNDWKPELNLGPTGSIPPSYVPEPEVRINLHARIARLRGETEVDILADEIEDRFGPLPREVQRLLDLASLREHCRQRGVARIDAGPEGVALTFRPGTKPSVEVMPDDQPGGEVTWRGERLVEMRRTSDDEERIAAALRLLDHCRGSLRPGSKRSADQDR